MAIVLRGRKMLPSLKGADREMLGGMHGENRGG